MDDSIMMQYELGKNNEISEEISPTSKCEEICNFSNNEINNETKTLPLKNLMENVSETSKSNSMTPGRKWKSKVNSFSLGRTCFRGMSNYYKDKFEPLLKEWEKNSDLKRPTMDELVTKFIKVEFDFGDDFFRSTTYPEFLDCMITVLHSQNHRKNDDYIKRRNFAKVRNLLYCYSSNAKKSFISDKPYALIFNNFYSKAGEALVTAKSTGKYSEFKEELRNELEDINKLALQTIAEEL